jgi:FdhD protein
VPQDATSVHVTRVRRGRGEPALDSVVVEAPLEIRVAGRPFAVVMRTPGADRELAAGFLFAERVLKSAADLGTIGHCTDPEALHPENIVTVTCIGASAAMLDEGAAAPRQTVASSSCGVCGRLSIEALAADCPPVAALPPVAPGIIAALPATLRARQAVFDRTGGLHAAGLFGPDGALLEFAEDVGRHNAVDKVIGRLVLREALPASGTLLFVSGRTSFEIVQKAWAAGVPCVASVSAPSSLAIDLARTAGIRLIGFVRDDTFNVYT